MVSLFQRLIRCQVWELVYANKTAGMALNLKKILFLLLYLVMILKLKLVTVVATGNLMSVNVGEGFLGRIVNALGEPIDGKGLIANTMAN